MIISHSLYFNDQLITSPKHSPDSFGESYVSSRRRSEEQYQHVTSELVCAVVQIDLHYLLTSAVICKLVFQASARSTGFNLSNNGMLTQSAWNTL